MVNGEKEKTVASNRMVNKESTFIWERETDSGEPAFERISGVAYVEQGPTHLVFRDAEGSIVIGLRASDVVSFFEED